MANMFNEDGTYNKTEWKAGDKITAVKLNKIELSLEAINNNDIDRHVESDSRLDILEERMTNTPDNEQMDALEDMVKDNKDAADLALYGINQKIESLESVNVNVDGRLDALESVNADSRLDALESVNADSRLDTLEEQVPSLYNNLPYEEYTRGKSVDFDGAYHHYQGFSNHSKKTYGRYENATVMSIVANSDDPRPGVLGADTFGLATYTNRDSVSLYTENSGTGPVLTILEGMTYTSNSAIIPESANIDMDIIRVGMIVDVGENANSDWCVGIISEINNRELIMEDGFYLVRSDDVIPKHTIPLDGAPMKIQWTNKVWTINSNVFVYPGCPAGVNMELGVVAHHRELNDVGGVDIINLGLPTHYGVKVRGRMYSFNEGYVSARNGIHFVGKETDPYTPLLRGIDSDGYIFDISTSGIASKQAYTTHVFTSSGAINNNIGVAFVLGDGINLELPLASDNPGRIIEIVSIGTGNLLTANTANAILTPDLNQQQISISKNDGKNMRAVRFVSDGGNMWYQLSDLY